MGCGRRRVRAVRRAGEPSFAYLANGKPTVEGFNALFQSNDDAHNWLFKGFRGILTRAGMAPVENDEFQIANALRVLATRPGGTTAPPAPRPTSCRRTSRCCSCSWWAAAAAAAASITAALRAGAAAAAAAQRSALSTSCRPDDRRDGGSGGPGTAEPRYRHRWRNHVVRFLHERQRRRRRRHDGDEPTFGGFGGNASGGMVNEQGSSGGPGNGSTTPSAPATAAPRRCGRRRRDRLGIDPAHLSDAGSGAPAAHGAAPLGGIRAGINGRPGCVLWCRSPVTTYAFVEDGMVREVVQVPPDADAQASLPRRPAAEVRPGRGPAGAASRAGLALGGSGFLPPLPPPPPGPVYIPPASCASAWKRPEVGRDGSAAGPPDGDATGLALELLTLNEGADLADPQASALIMEAGADPERDPGAVAMSTEVDALTPVDQAPGNVVRIPSQRATDVLGSPGSGAAPLASRRGPQSRRRGSLPCSSYVEDDYETWLLRRRRPFTKRLDQGVRTVHHRDGTRTGTSRTSHRRRRGRRAFVAQMTADAAAAFTDPLPAPSRVRRRTNCARALAVRGGITPRWTTLWTRLRADTATCNCLSRPRSSARTPPCSSEAGLDASFRQLVPRCRRRVLDLA